MISQEYSGYNNSARRVSPFRRSRCAALLASALALAAISTLPASPALAATPAPAVPEASWITLGTGGGPMPRVSRAESSNALLVGRDAILFDVGDGVVHGLAAAGIGLGQVHAVVISHLHPDHISGLQALIALRWQNAIATPLAIYGPEGTQELVDGILASLAPSERVGLAAGEATPAADKWVSVHQLGCAGETTQIGAVTVKSVRNSHYILPDGSEAPGAASCSFRIGAPSRTIVYTGDTGPSAAVTELAMGADLLVSEVIDVDDTFKVIERRGIALPKAQRDALLFHLSRHHVTPEQVGAMARDAKVKKLVLTHIAPGMDGDDAARYGVRAAGIYRGPVSVAKDGERF